MSHRTIPASLDASLEMLSHSYRRRLLLAVLNENPRDEAKLADEIITPDEVDADGLRAAKIQLHHVHLPKLDDKDYIEWQPETGTIRRGPNFGEIAPLLTLLDNNADEVVDEWP